MSLEAAEVTSLIAATMAMGLMAGVFGSYSHTIMRGLDQTDDRTFVSAFQSIDRAIINPLFMLAFLGALVFSGIAAVLYLRDDERPALPWVSVAFALYLVVVLITMRVNVPLNDELKAAGDPDRIADLAAVRANFHATRWVAWNHVRTVATTVAFGCLMWALVLHGRATSDDADASAHSPHTTRPAPDPSPASVSSS
jgi:uncharacterized membrane protein